MDTKSILKKIKEEHKISRFIQFLIGLMIVSLSYNIFNRRFNLTYGIGGVGLMLNKLINVDPSVVMLSFGMVLLAISNLVLDKETTKNSILGSILFPVFVKLTEPVCSLDLGNVETIMLVLCGSIMTGLGHGLIFKAGYSTGGTDILNQIVSKYGKMSVGKAMYFTDFVIIVIGFFVFDFHTFIYSVLSLYIISLMTDKVILGISQSKAFYIITEHETDVKRFITQNLSHGVTVLEARGGYTGDMQKVIMCIVPTKEYYKFKEGIKLIDKDAFFIVTDAYEVSGGV